MFKKLSIKTQIQFLSVSTVVFVLVIAAMAHYIYKVVETTQATVSAQQLPISHHSRQINNALAKLINHQKRVISSGSIAELEFIDDRADIEKPFEQHWQQLSELIKDSPAESELINSLHNYYEDFISLDDDLLTFKQQTLQSELKLQQQMQQLDSQLLNIRDEVKQLNKTNNTAVWRVLKSLNEQSLELEVVVLQSSALASDEQLDLLINKKFKQIKLSARADLATLALQQDNGKVRQLSKDFESLFEMINGHAGITVELKKKILASLLLKQTQESISAVIPVLLDKQGKLTESVNQRTYTAVSENTLLLQKNRWKVIAFGGLLTLLMIFISIWLVRSIRASLQELRSGMHALSEGKFDTRLSEHESHNEIDSLSHDFNRFAEKTQQLIEDYASAREALDKRKQHLRAVLNAVPEAILTVNENGRIVDANPAAEKVLDADQEILLGEDLRRFFANSGAAWQLDEVIAKARPGYEFEGLTYRDVPITVEVAFSELSGGEEKLWACVISDVTVMKSTDQKLHQTSSELNAILDNAMVGIAVVRDRSFIRVNHKFEDLFEYRREEIEGQTTQLIYLNEQAYQQFGRQAYEVISQGIGYEAQIEMRRKSGEAFWCALSGKVIDFDNPDSGVIWLFEDVTQQRLNEEHLTKLASQDTLTGLPNRTVFNDRLAHAIHKAHRNSGRLAIFFMDLDHFKTINDSLGHRVGDMLLVEVARRVKSSLREGDTVARLGGDEFTVVLEDVRSTEFVGKVAEKVLKAASQPYMIDGTEINISPSIGISLYPADGRDADLLIRNADAAMYHAKKHGRNNFQFYSAEMNAMAAERLAMETALRKAVEQNEFYLHYQPQMRLNSGQIDGAEALLRWNSAQWGDVSPAIFVPILEDTGLIARVGEWVLDKACRTYLSMADTLSPDFKMAVNLSGRQFKGGNLSSRINAILFDTGMPADNLELEITESMLMEDTELAIDTLKQLNKQGISLAIDDFGTGYSSLSYLKQFPLNVLKIDGSFVRDITTDVDDAAIVDAIIALADSLNLDVVAEGVETQEQLAYLSERGCKFAQGYLFSRPLSEQAFAEFVAAHQTQAI